MSHSACRYNHFRSIPKSEATRLVTQPNFQPMPRPHVITEQLDSFAQLGDSDIEIAIVIVIGDRETAADMLLR